MREGQKMNSSSSKASLFLMELIFSILFFLIATVVCVQMFVKSHTLSQESLRLNHSVIWSESVAEGFYACNGDIELLSQKIPEAEYSETDKAVYLYYDNDFFACNKENDDKRYMLSGKWQKNGDILTLRIVVMDEVEDKEIYSLEPSIFPDND